VGSTSKTKNATRANVARFGAIAVSVKFSAPQLRVVKSDSVIVGEYILFHYVF
jgi:hypothetical protein